MTARQQWIEEFAQRFRRLTDVSLPRARKVGVSLWRDNHADCTGKDAAEIEASYWAEEG